MSCRVLFWLSSSRALDTKVTKSREMMKKGMSQQQEEKRFNHRPGKHNKQKRGCYMAQLRMNKIRELFEWPVFTLESRSLWGLPIQRNYSISPEGRARSLSDWTTPSAC